MTAAGVGDGSLSAFIQAVHARHATAVINFVGFGVDARCLAVACAKSAAVALLGIYDRFEKRIPVPTGQIVLQYVRPPRHANMMSTTKVRDAMMNVGRLFIHTSVS